MSEIQLLVRADDIGMAHSVNEACLHVFRKGICQSVELMAPCPWFPEAITMLAECPDLDVGIHLTLTSEWDRMKWGPLTRAPSLVDSSGYFCRTFRSRSDDHDAFCDLHWQLDEVETELRAQIDRIIDCVPRASHLTGHMGVAAADERIGDLVADLEREYGLQTGVGAFERFRGYGDNSHSLSAEQKTRALCRSLRDVAPGRWLFVDHPAFDTPETRVLGHAGYAEVAADRQGVTQSWTDPEVRAIIAERGIQLVSYADVKAGS